MTNDSKLFPPRPKWEAEGYRPDEYSRWLKGNWRPIEELWGELGVNPSRIVPLDPECEGRIAAPDVQRTEWRLRCAQPPYDSLPIPRADVPAGIIFSRDGDTWLREGDVDDIALPLYEGRMIGQFDFSEKGWVRGTGRTAKWEEVPWHEKVLRPQYLMSLAIYQHATLERHLKQVKKEGGQDAVTMRSSALVTQERLRSGGGEERCALPSWTSRLPPTNAL